MTPEQLKTGGKPMRINFFLVSGGDGLKIPAYAMAGDGEWPQDAVARSIKAANRAAVIRMADAGRATDGSYRDYHATLIGECGAPIGECGVRIESASDAAV